MNKYLIIGLSVISLVVGVKGFTYYDTYQDTKKAVYSADLSTVYQTCLNHQSTEQCVKDMNAGLMDFRYKLETGKLSGYDMIVCYKASQQSAGLDWFMANNCANNPDIFYN